jgi:autotransporter-associated beta strand protein
LTKVGGGTLILQGASSYHGETIVAGGTLLINTQRDAITKRINLVDAPAPASPVLIPPSYNAGTGLTQFQLTQAIDTSGLSVGATVGNSILTAMNTSQNVFLFGEDATTAMTIVSPAGDFNADFYVDAADYAIWRKDPNVGSYDDWRNNFGSGPEGEVTFQGIDRGLYFWNDGTENNLVTVQSGATLGGTGKILGTHVDVLSGGTLAPGASIGTFDVGNATIAGSLAIEYDGSQIDKLVVADGALDITTASLDLSSLGALDAGTHVFAEYGSLMKDGTLGFGGGVNGLPAGFVIDYEFDGNKIALVSLSEGLGTAMVPEPASFALVGWMVAGLIAVGRKRAHRAI